MSVSSYSWLLEWFYNKGLSKEKTAEEQLKLNYFEAGLVDSFGVMELITEIETHFAVRFTETHFQERRFSTVGGLIAIVDDLLQSKTGK